MIAPVKQYDPYFFMRQICNLVPHEAVYIVLIPYDRPLKRNLAAETPCYLHHGFYLDSLSLAYPLDFQQFASVATFKLLQASVVCPHYVAAKLGNRLTWQTRAEHYGKKIGCRQHSATEFLSPFAGLVIGIKLLYSPGSGRLLF